MIPVLRASRRHRWENVSMKAITLHQPWATLVANGTKLIETRSWNTSYRGRLAIHAGKTRPVNVGRHRVEGDRAPFVLRTPTEIRGVSAVQTLPMGAVICIVQLVDVVPILDVEDELDVAWMPHVAENRHGELWHWQGPTDHDIGSIGRPGWKYTDVSDQRPYGDFTPGRFAWLFADLEPIEPVEWRGKQGLWRWDA